jgi:exodeoxyribonuclease V alpha subunit
VNVALAARATGVLREFNEAGVLAPADVHVAQRLAGIAGEQDERVMLAAALAVRGPRLGHVYVDLATIRGTATVDVEEPVDLEALPWPDEWLDAVVGSPLVAVGEEGGDDRPLRLVGSALYLDRYWREEVQVARDLLALGDRLEVIAGGPGTGKTTLVARNLARMLQDGADPALVALAAPTGKAAARLTEAVHEEGRRLEVPALLGLQASTLHRLLGWRPGTHSRFRHDRANRLPHAVVIVDETSMVSLSLMARLVEAVRADARLILVGDPGQLTSIEAGAVLGDIVSASEGITRLERVHRFGGAIANVAEAIRRGDGDATIEALAGVRGNRGRSTVTWTTDPEAVRAGAVACFRAVADAAGAGDGARAIAELGGFRILCAHRRGPHGVTGWTAQVERWLAQAGLAAEGEWYAGRPLLVTENDYGLGLYNGDTGVVIAAEDGRLSAAFERGAFSPARLGAVDTVYAMTVHKSQGSQFDTAAVLLPEADSPMLTRELLYTAVTRARDELILVGDEAAVRAAVARPVARASGLARRLASRDRCE